MKLNTLKARRALTLSVMTLGLMISYQNCSKVAFSPTPAASNASQGVVTPPVSCQSGYSYDGSNCVPQILGLCNNYVQLQPQSTGNASNLGAFVIPPRDTTETCYFIHMISAIDTSTPLPSNDWQTFRSDVVSRYHVTVGDSQAVLSQITGPNGHANFNPRVIGSIKNSDGSINTGATSNAMFTIQGTRTISLGGNSAGNIPMSVDNFILLETQSRSLGIVDLAEGSADAVPWATPTVASSTGVAPITVSGQAIPFISFGAGGTVDLDPKDISSYFPINDPVTVKTTGLDCGGLGGISDVFILFQ